MVKTKKRKNVKRKTLKGRGWGWSWFSKPEPSPYRKNTELYRDSYYDDDLYYDVYADDYDHEKQKIIEEIFLLLTPFKTFTTIDLQNMKEFKKIISDEFIHDYKANKKWRVRKEDEEMEDLIQLFNKHNYIVYPQIKPITSVEQEEFVEFHYKPRTKTKLYGGSHINDDERVRVSFDILQKLCYQNINFENKHFRKNVFNFQKIISDKSIKNYNILLREGIMPDGWLKELIPDEDGEKFLIHQTNRDDVIMFLALSKYSVHYSINE
jgi:hypothetical protein